MGRQNLWQKFIDTSLSLSTVFGFLLLPVICGWLQFLFFGDLFRLLFIIAFYCTKRPSGELGIFDFQFNSFPVLNLLSDVYFQLTTLVMTYAHEQWCLLIYLRQTAAFEYDVFMMWSIDYQFGTPYDQMRKEEVEVLLLGSSGALRGDGSHLCSS